MARWLGAAALALTAALLRVSPGAGAFVPQEIAGGQCVPLPAGICSSVMGSPPVWQFPGSNMAALDAKVESETSFIMKAAGGVADQTCITNFLFVICATW
jgi:hypothetical protein